MDRGLTRGRTFPDNVARSIKAPSDEARERSQRRDRARTSVIKESPRVNVARSRAAEVSHRETISRGDVIREGEAAQSDAGNRAGIDACDINLFNYHDIIIWICVRSVATNYTTY